MTTLKKGKLIKPNLLVYAAYDNDRITIVTDNFQVNE